MNGVLSEEQEKEIGIAQRLIEIISKQALMLLIVAPTMYELVILYKNPPEAQWAIVGAVVYDYFKRQN